MHTNIKHQDRFKKKKKNPLPILVPSTSQPTKIIFPYSFIRWFVLHLPTCIIQRFPPPPQLHQPPLDQEIIIIIKKKKGVRFNLSSSPSTTTIIIINNNRIPTKQSKAKQSKAKQGRAQHKKPTDTRFFLGGREGEGGFVPSPHPPKSISVIPSLGFFSLAPWRTYGAGNFFWAVAVAERQEKKKRNGWMREKKKKKEKKQIVWKIRGLE
jgi:hypothetical protein